MEHTTTVMARLFHPPDKLPTHLPCRVVTTCYYGSSGGIAVFCFFFFFFCRQRNYSFLLLLRHFLPCTEIRMRHARSDDLSTKQGARPSAHNP